jgi:DNA-directed RNA polymerase subunit RPC12/RpoP
LFDRVRYLEAYRCHDCGTRYHVSIASRISLSRFAKCPKCRYQDIRPMKRIDKVDSMRRGVFNFAHKILGGQLYHCWFCRLQFYDFRPLRKEKNQAQAESWNKNQPKTDRAARRVG